MNFLLRFGFFGLIAVGQVFSKTCSTEKNFSKNKEETSCTNLGLSVLPLTDIPHDTAILILSYNKFKSLYASAFKGFKELTELDVTDNGMTNFEIDTPLMLEELNLANNTLKALPKVSLLSSLTTLQLSTNHISTIPEDAFTGLGKLTRLELQHNNIDTLPEKVFEDLRSLKHLDLSYNQLWFLPTSLLSSVEDLEILYLSGNRLTEIPDHFFGNLELNYVYLEKNPWNCNCALQDFKNWLEEDEDRVYEISKEGPTKNQKSVVCSDGTPLIEYDMDHCLPKDKGDVDINSIPMYTQKIEVTVKAVKNEPMTKPMTTTSSTTTMLPTTTPTTMLPTTTPTTMLPTTTPTTMLPTTTPTTQATTVLPTTTPSTQATTMLPTTTPTTEATTILESTRTTKSLKTSPRTSIRSTTTPYPATLMMTTTEEPRTTFLIEDAVSTSEAATSEDRVNGSTMSPTDEPNLPVRSSRPAAFGMNWLKKVILENCCLLHVIIYGLCIFLLLVGMIITTMCLTWIYCCNQDLIQWLPRIRLIRYSMRVPTSDEKILLVNNGTIESHFRDQSLDGVTKMLVLESDTRQQAIRYTSAIL